MHKYGHMKVRALLRRYGVDPKFSGTPLVAQFSSIGSLHVKWLEEFCLSFLQCSSGVMGAPSHWNFPLAALHSALARVLLQQGPAQVSLLPPGWLHAADPR